MEYNTIAWPQPYRLASQTLTVAATGTIGGAYDLALEHRTSLPADTTFLGGYLWIPEHGQRILETIRPCLRGRGAHEAAGRPCDYVRCVCTGRQQAHDLLVALSSL